MCVRCFGQWITKMDWSVMNNIMDPEAQAHWFQQLITDQHRHCFESVMMKHRLNDGPWMSYRLRGLIASRDASFQRVDVRVFGKLRNEEERNEESEQGILCSQKAASEKESKASHPTDVPVRLLKEFADDISDVP